LALNSHPRFLASLPQRRHWVHDTSPFKPEKPDDG
jgi:hypothetical protein